MILHLFLSLYHTIFILAIRDKLYALSRQGVSFPRQGVKCHPLAPLGATPARYQYQL